MAMSYEDSFSKLKEILINEFELDPDSITPEAQLEDELGLDSLDVVDLLLSFSDFSGKKIDPTIFKNVIIVKDIVELL
jgi:acyl carrier protein